MQGAVTPSTRQEHPSLRLAVFVQGRQAPSSRFRILQYLPKLEALGISSDVFLTSPGPGGWTSRWLPGPLYHITRRASQVGVYLPKRYAQLRMARLENYDAVFLQKRLSPTQAGTSLEHYVAQRNPRIIFDVDDAVFVGAGGESSPAFRNFQSVCGLSRCVIAGNSFLAEHVRAETEVAILATTVDEERFLPIKRRDPSSPICIGWTGTGSNLRYLARLRPVFEELAREGVHFRIICNRVDIPELAGLENLECVLWNEDSEIEDLQAIDIGLMPLKDSVWTRGKCAFKLVQYMAIGIPAVASPVGANNEVLEHGVTGLFAESLDSWRQALRQLVEDAAMRRRMGDAARRRFIDNLSLSENATRMAALIQRVAAS